MTQTAPFPHALAELVDELDYKGWDVYLQVEDRGQGSKGLTLSIIREGPDTYSPDKIIRVRHLMPVPPAAFNRSSWQRWLFDQFLLVERHEAAEFFIVGEDRPFGPTTATVKIRISSTTRRRTRRGARRSGMSWTMTAPGAAMSDDASRPEPRRFAYPFGDPCRGAVIVLRTASPWSASPATTAARDGNRSA